MNPRLYPAIRWGALFGGGLAVFETATYLLVLRSGTASDLDVLSLILLVLEGIVPVVAGWLAAREIGEAAAGILAGLVSGVIVAGVSIVAQLVAPTPPDLAGGPVDLPTLIFGIALSTVMTVTLGIAGGWAGGRIGAGPTTGTGGTRRPRP